MDRRAFVRLVGGGVVMAAAAPLAGCSSAIPPQALAAWAGPGDEPDLRRWIVAHAILAPHSHNLQSWLVDLRTPDEIVLRCDRQRLLPVTDPYSRQIMMSHGTFLELLVLAARQRGQRAEVTLFPEGAFDERSIDDRPVARVRLVPDATLAPDPLFAQVLKRRTNRNAYDPARPVPADAWRTLAAAMVLPETPAPLAFGHIGPEDARALARHRAIASQAWKIEMTTPAAILETFKVLRVGAREIAEHRDGLSLTSPVVVAMTKLGLFDRSQAPAPDSYATTSQLEDFDRKIATTPGFLWITSEGNARTTQVLAGRAYLRVQLAGTALGLAMHPLQQALQEYPEQAGPYTEVHALLGAPQPGHTVQMWARVGHAEPVGPAPRRGLDAHLV
jgi:hypothetical protein